MDHFQKFSMERTRFQVESRCFAHACMGVAAYARAYLAQALGRIAEFAKSREHYYALRISACSLDLLFLQTLMLDLSRSLEDRQDSANLQIAILSFINVIINYKAGEVSLSPSSLAVTAAPKCGLMAMRACAALI